MVRRARQTDDRAGQPDAEVDAILLRRFPGRTLEELDEMDWPRYLRAMDAQAIIAVEEKRTALFRGDIKSMTDEEWQTIAAHEELLSNDQPN